MIKNIVFDLGGVLVPLNRSKCVNAFDAMGYDDFNSVINEYVQGGFFLDYERGKITTEQFRDIIRQNIDKENRPNVADSDIDDAMKKFLDPVSDVNLELLLSLRKNYRVFLLSNTNPIAINAAESYFAKEGRVMKDYFDHMFLSFEMNLVKPDKEIFERMLKEGNMKGDQTLYIDDSPANISTSEEIGIVSVLYSPGADLVETVRRYL
jgi:putative hydrolase of the HAD superfamily